MVPPAGPERYDAGHLIDGSQVWKNQGVYLARRCQPLDVARNLRLEGGAILFHWSYAFQLPLVRCVSNNVKPLFITLKGTTTLIIRSNWFQNIP